MNPTAPFASRSRGTQLGCVILLVVVLLSSWPADCQAQRFKLFSRQKSTSAQSMQLTEKAGPWLIMCASFDGIDAQQQASRLAQELRSEHRLDAYVYRKTFDIEQQVADKGWGFSKPDAPGKKAVQKLEMKLASGPVKEEFAVLVGDFPELDNARAQRTLEAIKKMQPKSLQQFSQGISDTALSGAKLRAQSDAFFGNKSGAWDTLNNQALRGDQPLRFAFLLINPMLPDEYLAANQIDRYVLGLNKQKGLKYSLLDNPQNYTIKIATFVGRTVVNDEEIEKLKFKKPSSSLVECAKKADILTKYLRSKGLEAYQFHDRYESYVCVGGFDWWSRQENGRSVYNPEAMKVVSQFLGRRNPNEPQYWNGYVLPGKLLDVGITCDSNPVPIAVPKVNTRQATIGLMRR